MTTTAVDIVCAFGGRYTLPDGVELVRLSAPLSAPHPAGSFQVKVRGWDGEWRHFVVTPDMSRDEVATWVTKLKALPTPGYED